MTLSPGDAAQIVTAAAAVIALLFGIYQVRMARDSQLESTAKQIWMTYELRGLEHPRFANPDLAAIDHEQKLLDGDRELYTQYEWFVSFMLLACEEVLRLKGGEHWENGVDTNLLTHRNYIKHPDFALYLKNLSPTLQYRIAKI